MSRPVLKPEEKHADHNPGYASAMAKAAEQYKRAMQDEKSREQWIENYLPLVKSIVGRLRHHFPESYQTEDMYGIGARALVIAVNKFDPGKGKAFGNYATLRIKGALLDELRKIDSLPRSNRAKARSLQATISSFEAKHKRTPSIEETRAELGLSLVEYQQLLKQTQPVTFIPIDNGNSRENNSGSEDNLPLSEVLADPTEVSIEDITEKRDKVRILRDLIKELPDQNKKILMLYYFEELKLSEIAQIFSLTEGRISQILSHSIMCIRSHFQTLDPN